MENEFAFAVNPDAPMAVYRQIEYQVQFAIASGRLESGDALPSVREMSERLKVNSNTITKAYRDLELMGLVNTKRGVGVLVAEKARRRCEKDVQETVRKHLSDATAACTAAGLEAREIRQVMESALKNGKLPFAP